MFFLKVKAGHIIVDDLGRPASFFNQVYIDTAYDLILVGGDKVQSIVNIVRVKAFL